MYCLVEYPELNCGVDLVHGVMRINPLCQRNLVRKKNPLLGKKLCHVSNFWPTLTTVKSLYDTNQKINLIEKIIKK